MFAQPEDLRTAAARLLEGRDPAPDDVQAVTELLAGLATRIDAAWSPPPVPFSAMVDEVAQRIEPDLPAAELAAAIERMHATDLYLALACRHGDREALRRFEVLAIAPLGPAVRRVEPNEAFVDEIRQRVRTKLLVPSATGKLSHYAGQGPLHTWVKVVAVREALDQRRGGKPIVSDAALADVEHGATGPEIGIVKAQYRAQFAAAFQTALSELEPAQRNLLRLHYLHGLGVDALAPLLGVHRSNAARRIQKARRSLLSNTRRRLQIELAIGRDEFEQLMTMIASRLDLSLERHMK